MYRRSQIFASIALLCLRVAGQNATTTYWEPSPPTNTPCSPLELVIARGTGEPGEYGVIVGDPLVNLTQQKIPELTAYPVNYPANYSLGLSISIGVNDTVTHLLDQSAKCPDQKYVLVGYSQGAAVTHLAVINSDLTSSFLEEKVIGFVVYGDPYNKGSGAPGAISALPSPLQTRLKENCECGDLICSNGTSFLVHVLSYVQPERGYHNVTSDYIKKAYDTNGAQGNQIFTSFDPSNNCTLQYCTNTTLAGGPPHTSGPLGVCAANGTAPGNSTTSIVGSASAPSLSTGTGTPKSSVSTATSAVGTGTGTSTGTGTGAPTPSGSVPQSSRPLSTGSAPVSSKSLPTGSISLPSLSLPTGSISLPPISLPTGSISLPSISLPKGSISLPSISLPKGSIPLPTGSIKLPSYSASSISSPAVPKPSSYKRM